MNDAADPIRTEIVQAAEDYFTRFGYSRVSTDEIVKSIGRSKKTLYKHFDTKEALLSAVVQRLGSQLERDLSAILEQTSQSGDEPLPLESVLEIVAMHLIGGSATLFTDLRGRAGDLYTQLHNERESALLDLLVRIVEDERQRGHLAGDTDARAIFEVFLISAEAIADASDLAANAGQTPAAIRTLVGMVTCSLRHG